MTDLKASPAEVAAEALSRVEAHPDTLRQRSWLTDRSGGEEGASAVYADEMPDDLEAAYWAGCGTTACVAGHLLAAAMTLDPAWTPKTPGPPWAPELGSPINWAAAEALGVEGGHLVGGLDASMFAGAADVEMVLGWLRQVASGEGAVEAAYDTLDRWFGVEMRDACFKEPNEEGPDYGC